MSKNIAEIKKSDKKKLVIFDFKSVLGIINFCIATICCMVCIGFLINSIITKDSPSNIFRFLGISVAMYAVYLFMLIFRVQLGKWFQLILNCHLLFAGFLGTGFGLYGKLEFYDDIMHVVMGFVAAIVGMYICCKLSNVNTLKPLFVCIILYGVAMSIGSIWEIWEFSVDNLLGQNSQGIKVNGIAPYVTDTMWDIIYNTIGSVVFILLYLLNYATKKSFLVGSLIKEFSGDNIK